MGKEHGKMTRWMVECYWDYSGGHDKKDIGDSRDKYKGNGIWLGDCLEVFSSCRNNLARRYLVIGT